jgi:hypothetical protein
LFDRCQKNQNDSVWRKEKEKEKQTENENEKEKEIGDWRGNSSAISERFELRGESHRCSEM